MEKQVAKLSEESPAIEEEPPRVEESHEEESLGINELSVIGETSELAPMEPGVSVEEEASALAEKMRGEACHAPFPAASLRNVDLLLPRLPFSSVPIRCSWSLHCVLDLAVKTEKQMTSELSCIRSEKATLISRVEALTEEVEHLEARAAELKSERDSLNES
ncbi:MAG: hypothetical protein SGPRY_014375, partial [Prymnesium sp.]